MTLQEISNLPRSQVALLNVYSYLTLYPTNYVKSIVVNRLNTVYCVGVHFINHRSGKEYVHSFNFYRLAELDDIKLFIETLSTTIGDFDITGDPIL